MYTLSSMAFIAAVVASARSPAKIANIALPPEKGETFARSLACNACNAFIDMADFAGLRNLFTRLMWKIFQLA